MLGYLSQRPAAPAQTTVSLYSTALHSIYASLVLQHFMFSYEGSVSKQKKEKGSSGLRHNNRTPKLHTVSYSGLSFHLQQCLLVVLFPL